MKSLSIITNERIYFNDTKNKFYAENIDCKSIIDGLNFFFRITLYARYSKEKKNNLINVNSILICKNFFLYFLNLFFKKNKIKSDYYLIISITPFTFLTFLLMHFIFRVNFFLYLRSNGFKEYEIILGKKYIFIYKLMYQIMCKRSEIISCHESLNEGKNVNLISPSELTETWFSSVNKKSLNKLKFLYVGRFKIEKGTDYIINLFKLQKLQKYFLTLVGEGEINNLELSSNIKIFPYVRSSKKLINIYDNHNIFILPSYTEAHPKVIDEALSRFLPVIIFDDIKNVIGNRNGIFSCKRDINDFLRVVEYIKKNYQEIIKMMKYNKLPTKEKFIKDFYKVLVTKKFI
jgi:glycosyltransferase involved in cell wall biosynthesis